MIPPKDQITICFAHAAYQMKACFDALNTGITSFELRDRAELDRRIGEADVLVVSGMWHNGLIELGSRLRFIQSIGSGTDQFDKVALTAKGVRLASAAGVNARAVAEHAMALDAGDVAAAAGGARQPGAAGLARHDRRSDAA